MLSASMGVEICGLRSAEGQKLNGQQGTLDKWLDDRGRWVVRVDRQLKLLKEANLEQLPARPTTEALLMPEIFSQIAAGLDYRSFLALRGVSAGLRDACDERGAALKAEVLRWCQRAGENGSGVSSSKGTATFQAPHDEDEGEDRSGPNPRAPLVRVADLGIDAVRECMHRGWFGVFPYLQTTAEEATNPKTVPDPEHSGVAYVSFYSDLKIVHPDVLTALLEDSKRHIKDPAKFFRGGVHVGGCSYVPAFIQLAWVHPLSILPALQRGIVPRKMLYACMEQEPVPPHKWQKFGSIMLPKYGRDRIDGGPFHMHVLSDPGRTGTYHKGRWVAPWVKSKKFDDAESSYRFPVGSRLSELDDSSRKSFFEAVLFRKDLSEETDFLNATTLHGKSDPPVLSTILTTLAEYGYWDLLYRLLKRYGNRFHGDALDVPFGQPRVSIGWGVEVLLVLVFDGDFKFGGCCPNISIPKTVLPRNRNPKQFPEQTSYSHFEHTQHYSVTLTPPPEPINIPIPHPSSSPGPTEDRSRALSTPLPA